MFSYGYTQC